MTLSHVSGPPRCPGSLEKLIRKREEEMKSLIPWVSSGGGYQITRE